MACCSASRAARARATVKTNVQPATTPAVPHLNTSGSFANSQAIARRANGQRRRPNLVQAAWSRVTAKGAPVVGG